MENKKRYEVECPACKKKIYVEKSLGMEIGLIDRGFGKCCHCKAYLVPIYNREEDTMTVELFKKEDR